MAVFLNRITPRLGPQAYKSYTLAAPLGTHWRPASCAEFECGSYLYGWVTVVDVSTELGQRQADFIRHDKTRRATETRTGDVLVEFTFGPGQEGFRGTDEHNHRVPVGRPPLMLVRGGDHRGNPRGTPAMSHRTIEDWVEDFSAHQDRLKAAAER
jgi:hypothetical protein